MSGSIPPVLDARLAWTQPAGTTWDEYQRMVEGAQVVIDRATLIPSILVRRPTPPTVRAPADPGAAAFELAVRSDGEYAARLRNVARAMHLPGCECAACR